MAKPTTSGFTISGLLDRSASIRNDYPVERIPIEEIADHPANAAYSMDDVNSALAAPKMAVPAGGSADAMSDEIYARFAERSVGVENRIHDFRIGFDKIAPYLALAVLAIFAIAVFVSVKLAG